MWAASDGYKGRVLVGVVEFQWGPEGAWGAIWGAEGGDAEDVEMTAPEAALSLLAPPQVPAALCPPRGSARCRTRTMKSWIAWAR